MGIVNRIDEKLENNDAKGILKVIGEYSKTLDLLDDYDHKTLKKVDGNIQAISFKALLGQDIYKSIEEKSANFLYLIVKNHVFADGNKRIAATLFIYFLNFYGILYIENKQVIDNNTLTALTLLIAESQVNSDYLESEYIDFQTQMQYYDKVTNF